MTTTKRTWEIVARVFDDDDKGCSSNCDSIRAEFNSIHTKERDKKTI